MQVVLGTVAVAAAHVADDVVVAGRLVVGAVSSLHVDWAAGIAVLVAKEATGPPWKDDLHGKINLVCQ